MLSGSSFSRVVASPLKQQQIRQDLATPLAPGAARQSLIESLFREVQNLPTPPEVRTPRPPPPGRAGREETRGVIPQRLRDTGINRLLPQRLPPSPPPNNVTTPLLELAKRARMEHDVVADRGFEELADKDPTAASLTSEMRPGAGPRVSASYRTPGGYYLELLTDRERLAPMKAQGYRIFRPAADNPNTAAELFERHFDASSRYALLLDQKTITHPEGYRQLTEVRRHRDESFSHSRVEKLVQRGFNPVDADAHLVGSPGFARFLGMLGAVAQVEYTRIQQNTTKREAPVERMPRKAPGEQPQAETEVAETPEPAPESQHAPPPPATPGGGAASQAPIKSVNPVAVLLLELSLMASDLPNLPMDGVYEVMRSGSGPYLQMFVPDQGRRVLTIHGSRGDLLYYEEDEDAEQGPYQVSRRLTLDVPARQQKRERRRTLDGRCLSEEERTATWQEPSELGSEGRESVVQTRATRRYPNGVEVRLTGDQTPLRHELTRERREGEEIFALETRVGLAGPQGAMECINRSHARRGSTGQEIRRREGDVEERHGSFAEAGQTAVEYSVKRTTWPGMLHQVTTWSRPRRSDEGETVLSVDNRRRSAARRRRRRSPLQTAASEWAPADARTVMVQDDALHVEPTQYVTCRWDVSLSAAAPSEDAASEPLWTTEEGLAWHLAEEVETLRTEGVCQGPRGAVWQFVDSVTHRLSSAAHGEVSHRIDVASDRFSGQQREIVRRFRYQDGKRVGEAAGRHRTMPADRAAQDWMAEAGSGLLALLGSGRLRMERVEGRLASVAGTAELRTFTSLQDTGLAVLRLQQGHSRLWLLRTPTAVQAFRDGSRNTAWATRWPDGERARAEIMVDLPQAVPPLQGELREASIDGCNREAVDALLKEFNVDGLARMRESIPTVAEFDTHIGNCSDLSILVRTLDGADDIGLISQGERIQIKTPEGDVLVLLRRGMMSVPFAWMRGADGREHMTVPHDHRLALLVLSADESGVYGELHGSAEERDSRQSLGRLEAWSKGLLSWLSHHPSSPLLDGFMQRACDFAQGVGGVARYPGPDEHLVASVLWDFSRLAWSEHADQSLPASTDEIQLLSLTGVPPLEAAAALMARAGADQRPAEPEAIAPLS
ncbi:MAG: hypothetical protein ACYCW6_17050, partial [Candidatus Xenobia bacterium]